jgi:hypothetical protein
MATTKKPAIGELLHRINEGATDSSTPLGDVMRLCLRLGSLLGNKELSDWAKAEGGGYTSRANLPDYRVFETEVKGNFSGWYGRAMQHAPIPHFWVEEAHRDLLCKAHLTHSVGELERFARGGRADTNVLTIAWPADAMVLYQRKPLYQGFVLVEAEQILSTTVMAGILEEIRTRVIEFVLTIETELNIDIMDYDTSKKPLEAAAQEKVSQIFNTTIHGGSNFALGNSGTTNQQAIQVQPGDLKGLKEKLAELGVPDVLVSDLDTALSKDADSEEQPGPHVKGWFGRLATKVGTGAIQLAGTATALVVMTEVKRFLGLPPV